MERTNPAAKARLLLPSIPTVPSSHEQPSPLYKLVLDNLENPPILKGASWTKAAPFKEEKYARTPSESIANNYTPSASNIKLRALRRRTRSSPGTAYNIPHPPLPVPPGYHAHQRPRTGGRTLQVCPSRPLSPKEQFNQMSHQIHWLMKVSGNPTESDVKRYKFYLTQGVTDEDIEPMTKHQMNSFYKRLLPQLVSNFADTCKSLEEEILNDYNSSLKKAIVDYILMDPQEKRRLRIGALPLASPQRIIRAPVPWHDDFRKTFEAQEVQLFIGNDVMLQIQKLWHDKYSHLTFVKCKDLCEANLPTKPADFEELVKKQCSDCREKLEKEWVLDCSAVFRAFKDSWSHLIPNEVEQRAVLAEHFFNTASSLMNRQLRDCVKRSIDEFINFLTIYQGGNSYSEDFNNMLFTVNPALRLDVFVHRSELSFTPPIEEVENIINRLITVIVESSHNIPRVEHVLFPDLHGYKMVIPSVSVYDEMVIYTRRHANDLLKVNFPGIKKYKRMYNKYRSFLDGTASQELDNFFKEDHESLKVYGKRINELQDHAGRLKLMPCSVYLNLFILDVTEVNNHLILLVEELIKKCYKQLLNQNREFNRDICRRYDDISSKVYEEPHTTEEIVQLSQFLLKSRDETVYKLKLEVGQAAERVLFLFNYVEFTEDDLKLNSQTFNWPSRMDPIFEVSQKRLATRREKSENDLKEKIKQFEELLNEYQTEIDTYKDKEVIQDFNILIILQHADTS
jgi:dynein heavy chain